MAGNADDDGCTAWCDKLCDMCCGPNGVCPDEDDSRGDWNSSPFDDNDEDGAPLLRSENAVVNALPVASQPQSDFITVVG